ncbi:MAG: T9SS type A sorting domain-containing protein [Flavobacteriia bacterium]|nr:T9SS type A sorting domain-containing protein [Flavobacteriia bacterium]
MKIYLIIISILFFNKLEAQSFNNQAFVYPNPVSQHLYIALVDDSIQYEIISLQGEKILKGLWIQNETQFIDVHQLHSGLYFVKLNEEIFHLKKE